MYLFHNFTNGLWCLFAGHITDLTEKDDTCFLRSLRPCWEDFRCLSSHCLRPCSMGPKIGRKWAQFFTWYYIQAVPIVNNWWVVKALKFSCIFRQSSGNFSEATNLPIAPSSKEVKLLPWNLPGLWGGDWEQLLASHGQVWHNYEPLSVMGLCQFISLRPSDAYIRW